RQTRHPQRPPPQRHAPLPRNQSPPTPPQLVHVLLPTPVAARSRLLCFQLPPRRPLTGPLQPRQHVLRPRPRPIPRRLVATRRAHLHDQLVPRRRAPSHKILRLHCPRPHPHPLGRTRRL